MFGKAETIEPSAFSNTRVIRTPYAMVEYKIRADILLIARIFCRPIRGSEKYFAIRKISSRIMC